jgi:hypothetical protein
MTNDLTVDALLTFIVLCGISLGVLRFLRWIRTGE